MVLFFEREIYSFLVLMCLISVGWGKYASAMLPLCCQWGQFILCNVVFDRIKVNHS